MDQIYIAFVETVLDPIDERFGKVAATLAALVLVTLPIGGLVAALWMMCF